MKLRHGLHLAYCTNVHRGETWAETFQSLNDHTLAVKAAVSPDAPYAIGLRLSDAASRELSDPQTLDAFRRWLDKHDCYVFTINGFPFGRFHGGRVKEQVYSPDWTTPERLAYTNRLFDLLAALLPEGIEGSVSTLPGSFKGFIFGEGRARHSVRAANIPNGAQGTDAPYLDSVKEKQMRDNLWRCVEHIAALSERTGKTLHLGLEPEPLGYLENSEETLKFFAALAAEHSSDPRLLRHLGVNYDTCHFAIEYEEPEVALKRFADAGIRISKIHISNALKLQPTTAAREQLTAFQDQVYLHQVIARRDDGSLVRYLDLDSALSQQSTINHQPPDEWRVHFHIPLHAAPMGQLQNTSDHILGVFRVLAANPALCSHLEMETYTWEVMPAAFRNRRVEEQLVSEYEWTLARLREHDLAEPERVGRVTPCAPLATNKNGARGATRPTSIPNLQPATCNFQLLTTLLTLGRVSNLPTVWSNCIAAWLLAGGKADARLAFLCAGGSFLYVGGMFLNDACDVSFDHQHRAERPIPSGAINRSPVFAWAILWLIVGAALCVQAQASVLMTLMLVVAITTYNFLHKIFPPAIVLMAACRFLLYLVAASAIASHIPVPVLTAAAVIAVYVFGISLLARNESSRQGCRGGVLTVGRLIAGIVLLDCANVMSMSDWSPDRLAIFLPLFFLTLLLQKRVAAT